MRRIASFASLAVLLALMNAASAQTTDSAAPAADPIAAAALFQEGRDLAKRGEFAAAYPKLAESYRLDPGVGTLINLADCEAKLGRLASAWQHFREAYERLWKTDTRLPIVMKKIAELEPRLPRIHIDLAPSAPAGTKILRDDVELGSGSIGTALPVNPGEHAIVVKSPDREDRRYTVTGIEGKTERIQVEPGEPAAKPPPAPLASAAPVASVAPKAPPPAPAPSNTIRTVGFIVGGVGLAGLAFAGVTSVMLSSNNGTIEEHCGKVDPNGCDPEGFDAVESSRTLLPINTAAWIAGGVLTAAGVTLVLVSPRSRAQAAGTLHFNASPGGAGVSIGGRF